MYIILFPDWNGWTIQTSTGKDSVDENKIKYVDNDVRKFSKLQQGYMD